MRQVSATRGMDADVRTYYQSINQPDVPRITITIPTYVMARKGIDAVEERNVFTRVQAARDKRSRSQGLGQRSFRLSPAQGSS